MTISSSRGRGRGAAAVVLASGAQRLQRVQLHCQTNETFNKREESPTLAPFVCFARLQIGLMAPEGALEHPARWL